MNTYSNRSFEMCVQGQLATYKEMAAAAEADRGRLEAEVVATAQLATAVEARLRIALAAKDAAESRVAAAELRAHKVSEQLPCRPNVHADEHRDAVL